MNLENLPLRKSHLGRRELNWEEEVIYKWTMNKETILTTVNNIKQQ